MIDRQTIIRKAITKYGLFAQHVVAMEELGELIQAISKHLRGKDNKQEIITEMADVYVMLEELKMMDNISDKEIDAEIDYKLVRLNGRLEDVSD